MIFDLGPAEVNFVCLYKSDRALSVILYEEQDETQVEEWHKACKLATGTGMALSVLLFFMISCLFSV